MAIQSELLGSRTKSDKFPIIKKSKYTSLVVLFNGKQTGMVIYGDSNNPVGQYYDEWAKFDNKEVWEDFDKSVTLFNI